MATQTRTGSGAVPRRDFVRLLAVAGLATACTPVRIGLKLYPRDFHDHPELVDETLQAFVLTVIPGMPENDPDLTRHFYDEFLEIGAHREYLAYDLCVRAGRLTGERHFAALDYQQRERVVADGLAQGGVTTLLYSASVHVTQIACYAGIYDDEKGCPVTDFEGRFQIERMAGVFDPNLGSFREITAAGSGNPV